MEVSSKKHVDHELIAKIEVLLKRVIINFLCALFGTDKCTIYTSGFLK